MQDIQAPYPLIEFDAHKAARTYAAFAQALQDNEAAIAHALQERRARALQDFKGRHPNMPAPSRQPVDHEKQISWAIRTCEIKAAPLLAGLGRAWLPERTVLTLLRMESGQALTLLLETGDLHQALGIDRPRM